MRRHSFLAGLAGLAGASTLPARTATTNDLIVTGATIHTVDRRFGEAEAFVVRGAKVAFVGSLRDARAFAGPSAKTLDFSGATILPGLIDAHLHLVGVGLDMQQVDLFHDASFDDVVARTVAFARASPDRFVQGDGWDQNLWPGKAFPTHDKLSAALPDRPVVLWRVDGHALLANAYAMRLAGVGSATPNPTGGSIVRDAQGNPTGVFVDNAMALIDRIVPDPTDAQVRRAAQAAIGECNRWGVTAIGDPGVSMQRLFAYDALAARGSFSLRNHAMLSDDPELLSLHFAHGPIVGAYGGIISVRAVKMFVDGALGSRGAALLEPYSDDPGNRGLLRITQAHIEEVASQAARAGFQVCVHAIGDRGDRIVLDAYERVLSAAPKADRRWRVEHAQVLHPNDIPRFAQLGVIPSMQTTHQISDMGWAQERLGPQRILGAYAWRSLLDTGVIVPNGTDAPVEAINPLRTFHAAISRQNEQNQPAGGWYPEQRMRRAEALASMTIWAAHASFMERRIGSISPGKRADFVVMDRDWLRAAPEAIMETRILATYFDGKQVHEANGKPAASLRPRRGRACCS